MLADRIICVSETTRKALLARHPVDPERVVVVRHGIDHVEHADPPTEAELDALGLPDEFVLFAGSLDARKNVSCVLEAMRRLRRSGKRVPLVLIGQKWFGSGPAEAMLEAVRAEGCAIHPMGYQPEGVLYAVMRRAKLFVFPSRYEGFGLPPLEAMWQGTPVVISTAEALREVCGDAAVQVDPDSPEALAAAIARLWDSKAERARLSEAGRRHARGFTWAKAAKETLEVYRSALEDPLPARPR